MATPAVSFNLAPAEALKFFRAKGLSPTFAWQDMLHEEHDRAFTIAKMLDMDLLEDVRQYVEYTIREGKSFKEFVDDLKQHLIDKGWWGQQAMADPLTGEVKNVQLGSVRRLRTIYDTNLRTSYAAGHWEQIERNQKRVPYVKYSAVLDTRTRAAHAKWHGTVLRWDDPWWKTHTPPCGWGCRCTVISVNDRELKRMGKDGPDQAPDSPTRDWTNPRTGEVIQVPAGVDPGWGYPPGAENRAKAARMLLKEKADAAPADVRAAVLPFVTRKPDEH